MADEVERKDGGAGRIEGGVDAIVVGANADGLTAAGYLGKAGLKTVVLDSSLEVGGLIQERVFDDGRSFLDGDRLLNILDAAAVADLELYRHGLSYAARRLATTYFFKSGDSIELPGDLQAPAQNSTDFDVKGFTQFVEDVFDTASYLRPAFESSIDKQSNVVTLDQLLHDASADFAERIKKFTVSDAQSIIEKYVATQSLQSALISETVFRQENSPQDAFSFMALVRRWAGEIAGLQGAIGYPAGGGETIIASLRRAVQSFGVEIRAAQPVQSILTEWDKIAGVELERGGQIRAPIVVAANSAKKVFLDLIGPDKIGVDFQHCLSAVKPRIASARLMIDLKGAARDEETLSNMQRRLVYAPDSDALRRAYAAARAGEVPEEFVLEAIFPDILDDETRSDDRHQMFVTAHPVPFKEKFNDDWRATIEAAVRENLEIFSPGISERISNIICRMPADDAKATGEDAASFAARAGVFQQFALSSIFARNFEIEGLFFCGAESQIGTGVSCSAGRSAAQRAIKFARTVEPMS